MYDFGHSWEEYPPDRCGPPLQPEKSMFAERQV